MPKRNPINATQPLKTRKHRTATQQSLQRPQLERGGNFPFPHNFFFSHRRQRKNTNTYVDRRSSDPDHSLRCGQPHSAHKHKIFVTFTIFHFTSSHSITNHSNCFLTAQRQGWQDWEPGADWPGHVAGTVVGLRLTTARGDVAAGVAGARGRERACVQNSLPTCSACSPPVPFPQDTCFLKTLAR